MEQLEKRLSYVRGLADGLDVGTVSKEGKMICDVIELLDELIEEVKDLGERVADCEKYIEVVDHDLSDLEYDVLGDEKENQESTIRYYLEDEDGNYYDLDDSEDVYLYDKGNGLGEETTLHSYEIECPTCKEQIFFEESLDKEGFLHYTLEPMRDHNETVNPT